VAVASAVALALAKSASANPSEPIGTWYLNANNYRISLSIGAGGAPNTYVGTVTNENGGAETVDNIAWNDGTHRLRFRRVGTGFWQWYNTGVQDGVMVGRFSHSGTSSAQPALSEYRSHVTGWNSVSFDQALTPRVFELIINTTYLGRLRIDASPEGGVGFSGRLKVYSTTTGRSAGEELEYDVQVTQWDGTKLKFTRHGPAFTQLYNGVVSGRTVSGTFTHNGAGAYPWSGTRAEVLTYGYGMSKGPQGRQQWQDRTRRQLAHLMMADNPLPGPPAVTTVAMNQPPIPSAALPSERDDDPAHRAQNYTRMELRLTYTFPTDAYGKTPSARTVHAQLAVPTTAPPPGGKYPAVLAVNGHGGSAWKMLNPDDAHWYGDSFARRGFVVMAVDISHRSLGDRQAPYMRAPLYSDTTTGDDSLHGNDAHPSIKAPGFDSDWEEDGERAWDAMRALDYLLGRPNVDTARVLVTGLSMGGEITTIVGGLDSRLAMSIPVGFSPDLGVMFYNNNHPCWQWLHGDVREYVDTADFYALTAPRPLIVQTGKVDRTFSALSPPFAADKQVARRVRTAYGGETANFLHYLHYDGHRYHVGDVNPTHATEADVRIPEVIAPTAVWSPDWSSDAQTRSQQCTLFQCVAFFLRQ
jgi:dienelactone hydrolase